MKFHILSLALAAYVSTVAAQSIDSLPACAQSCATNSIPSSCSSIDFACICSNRSFITDISCCVSKSCEADQQAAVIQFADELCSGVGVTDLPKSATCAAGASTSSSSTTNAETTTTGTSSSSTTPASNTVSETSSGSSATTTTTGTSTSSAKAASSSSAAAAPAQNRDASLLAAAGAAAAFALLV